MLTTPHGKRGVFYEVWTRPCFQRLLDSGHGTRHLDRRAMGADSPVAAIPKAQDRAPEQRPSQHRERHFVDRPHRSLEWRDLPPDYGPWRSVATRFYRWVKAGVWDRVLGELQRQAEAQGELDWKLHHVDGSVVQAHQHAAGAKKGKLRRGGNDDARVGRRFGGSRTKPGWLLHQDTPARRGGEESL
jgi:transposase